MDLQIQNITTYVLPMIEARDYKHSNKFRLKYDELMKVFLDETIRKINAYRLSTWSKSDVEKSIIYSGEKAKINDIARNESPLICRLQSGGDK